MFKESGVSSSLNICGSNDGQQHSLFLIYIFLFLELGVNFIYSPETLS